MLIRVTTENVTAGLTSGLDKWGRKDISEAEVIITNNTYIFTYKLT